MRHEWRFIPTYVGHTTSGNQPMKLAPVHPHIRGAYPPQSNTKYINNGSSPHTWGIRFPFWLLFSGQRFIPTYVGHTPVFTAAAFAGRFIPTYVGHTGRTTENRRQIPVHPHIRGAYCPEVGDILETIGSSPHTWGILKHTCTVVYPARFIPTYVGHTNRMDAQPGCSAVHPHIRGAYSVLCAIAFAMVGSSPHTWGILFLAGKFDDFIAVHPHIRGAYTGETGRRSCAYGSSPHTWGIHSYIFVSS